MPTVALAGLSALGLGMLLMTVAVVMILRKLLFVRRTLSAAGTITRCERADSMNGGWVYTPTVRFESADGRTQEYTPRISSSSANYRVGESVPVFYDPLRPGVVMLGRPASLGFWLAGVVLMLTGATFAVVGVVMYVIADGRGFELLDRLFT